MCRRAGVKLEYLPPYSPDYNPIEESFSKLKAWIRRNNALISAYGDFKEFLAEGLSRCGDDAPSHFASAQISVPGHISKSRKKKSKKNWWCDIQRGRLRRILVGFCPAYIVGRLYRAALKRTDFFLLQYQHVSPTRSHRPPPIHHVNSFRISVPQYPPCQANQENGGTNVVGLMGHVKRMWSSAVRGYKSFFH